MEVDRISFSFWAARAGYYLRVRGWRVGDSGEPRPFDTKEKIPDAVFRAADPPAKADRRTARGDQIAALYAATEQERRSAAATAPAVAREMSLEEVWRLYQRKNPEQVKPESMERSAKWARALLRCRCYDDGDGARITCIAHRPPSTISLATAEDFRNFRLRECRTCAVTRDEHEQPHELKRGRISHEWTGVSPRTCYNEIGFAIQLLEFAKDRASDTGVTAIALTRRPAIVGKKGIYKKKKFAPEEYFALRDATSGLTDGARYRLFYDFTVSTGLRLEVAAGFDVRWYDRESRMIHVPAERMKGRGDDHRPLDVPISRWAASCLDAAIAAGATTLAWPNPENGFAQENFFGVERALSNAIGLDRKFSHHALRGTFNTWLIGHRCEIHTKEVPFFVREKLMGHALPEQVETYSDFSVAVLREATDVLDCIFTAHQRARENVLNFARRA